MPKHSKYRNSRRPRRKFKRISHRGIVRHRFALLAIGILALFAFGLVLGHLEREARERSPITGKRQASPLDPVNPFLKPSVADPADRNTGDPGSVADDGQTRGSR